MTQCFCSSGFCDAARPWALGEILATMGQIPHQIPRPQPPPHSQLRSDRGSESGLETVKDKFANQCCFSYHVQFCRFAAFTFCCSSQTVQCDIVDSKMIDVRSLEKYITRCKPFPIKPKISIIIREHLPSEKSISFGHCPNSLSPPPLDFNDGT